MFICLYRQEKKTSRHGSGQTPLAHCCLMTFAPLSSNKNKTRRQLYSLRINTVRCFLDLLFVWHRVCPTLVDYDQHLGTPDACTASGIGQTLGQTWAPHTNKCILIELKVSIILNKPSDHTVTSVCTTLPAASSPLLGYTYEALCHYVVSCHFNTASPTHQNYTELGLYGQKGLMVIPPQLQ